MLPLLALLPLLSALGARLLAHLPELLTLRALRSALLAHLTHLLALLTLALPAGLLALSHRLALLPLTLALTHRIQLRESLALAVHLALTLTLALLHLATCSLAVGTVLLGHAVAGTVDHHYRPAGAVATGTTRSHAWVVGIVNHIHGARSEGGTFGDHIIAHFVHLLLVRTGVGFGFDGTKKVGQIFVLVAHIPALVGQFLVGEIDAGKLLLKFLGVQFPSRLDGGGGEHHGVSG